MLLVAEEVTAFLCKANKATLRHVRKDHPGQSGLLTQHTEALLRFIFERSEQGHGISTAMVVRKASEMSQIFFKDKTHHAK